LPGYRYFVVAVVVVAAPPLDTRISQVVLVPLVVALAVVVGGAEVVVTASRAPVTLTTMPGIPDWPASWPNPDPWRRPSASRMTFCVRRCMSALGNTGMGYPSPCTRRVTKFR
jgi:hypothetical protein